MKRSHQVVLTAAIFVVAVTGAIVAIKSANNSKDDAATALPSPVLTVSVTTPKISVLPVTLSANGDISAWQEAIIGNETDGLRLAEVAVNVGDKVQRGELLATFSADTVKAELAQSDAAVAEAQALLAEAREDVKRATELQTKGALTAQQVQQYSTVEKTARARLKSAQAYLDAQQLRLKQTQVLAPDSGIISSRTATVGAVLPRGEELFRLIRGNRLEWRAEVSVRDLNKLHPGLKVQVTPAGGEPITAKVRTVAPLVNTQTRSGLVYVDLPSDNTVRAGSFAHGQFELGTTEALTLPQSAVQMRDGFSYVMRIDEKERVWQTKVITGQRSADLVEIVSGITAMDRVVINGSAFLGDGDLVRIAPTPSSTGVTPSQANRSIK
ncbi:efflux RND transporter periplasmic adaptor subunit [Idiomarina loihiensis]|uniref:efflux RND transporter periplasmic adaptor subunit n=1 Tax=Idiomarina loihiensis TaxID=135577 RepID=UPI00129CDECE|nr:efflux RND transporter periplasmic adaptor subunit [Idiomarina loihiensis]MRJ44373.1 efflux RND transporter periplasmic adaptor subunit [Idiomarina loihiensis]UTW32589.1 efflux RND transporter periplasmic adaptor subunit [Idiomarina loihiensis]